MALSPVLWKLTGLQKRQMCPVQDTKYTKRCVHSRCGVVHINQFCLVSMAQINAGILILLPDPSVAANRGSTG